MLDQIHKDVIRETLDEHASMASKLSIPCKVGKIVAGSQLVYGAYCDFSWANNRYNHWKVEVHYGLHVNRADEYSTNV